MEPGGLIFMFLSWTMILGLVFFCFRLVFRKGLGGEDSKGLLKRLKK